MNINMEFEGLENALSKIKNYQHKVKNGVIKEVASATVAVQSGAVKLAPVDTGNFKNSYGIFFNLGGLSATVSNSAHYGMYLEFGTRKMAAQPSLFPAYNMVLPIYLAGLRRVLNTR